MHTKIAYVSLTHPNDAGGIGVHLHGMARALGRRGHEVLVIYPDTDDGVVRKEHYTLMPLRTGGRSALQRAAFDLRLARALRRIGPDLILMRLNTSAVAAPLTARLSDSFYACEVNGPLWSELDGEARSPVAKFLARSACRLQLRSAQACVGVTPRLVDALRRFGPTVEIPNGSDFDRVRAEGRKTSVARLVFAGAFTQWYDLGLVLDTLPEIERALGKRTECLLIGDGPRKDGIVSRVGQSEWLRRRVTFAPWMERERALERVAEANVGLIPLRPKTNTDIMGSPLKLFDYLALGLPTVIPPLDGCTVADSRLVRHYRTGCARDFAAAVVAAYACPLPDDDELERLRSTISWDRRARTLIEFVQTVDGGGCAAASE